MQQNAQPGRGDGMGFYRKVGKGRKLGGDASSSRGINQLAVGVGGD
jgi:hypothetical protein